MTQGFTIGFISDHNYVQAPGSESDSTLLLDTVSDPSSPYDWAVRATDYTDLLNQYLGPAGKNVELLTTEFNSVYSNPGKQTTSLVNGLFIADSLGELLQTPYEGATVWDLRNGYDTSNNNSSSLYGWRDGGDYGLIGSPGTAPDTGTYVPYPSYFAEQLGSEIIQAGGNVVQATSDDPNLAVYAVQESNGHLDLLVINKSASGPITGQFALTDFQPAAQAQFWQYGEAQDTAQSESATGQSALASFTATVPLSGSGFSYSFPAYSMTVVDLSPGTSSSGPTITSPAASTANPVAGITTDLSVTATDPAGASSLTYTWSAISPVPAGVAFSGNGTNAASQTTATFSGAGSYNFQVIVADPSGLTATSDVTVNVEQVLTSIAVSPAMATVAAGDSRQFAAQADDQFGDLVPLPGPVYAWSLVSGIGSINSFTGVYTAPGEAGSAEVKASLGSLFGTASITVIPTPPGPTITSPAAATANPVAGTTTDLSVTATDPAGASSLTYTWSAISPLSAGVVFSVNGTNAASQTTATFSRAGSFNFQVIVADPSGLTATSDVTVYVEQVLTSIVVSPAMATVAAGDSRQFTAQADDQFGDVVLLPGPGYAWSLVSGIGSINSFTGVYTAPGEAGAAEVKASLGSLFGTASVTVTPPTQAGLSATVHYTDSADWRTGFVGDVMITNTGSSAINAWTLQFNFAPKIIAIWGAAIAKHTGNQYTIDNVSADTTIAPGQSISFGFQGKPGRARAGPSNISLNGVSLPLSPWSAPLSAKATFTVVSRSRSGFDATVTIANMGTVPIGGWALQFNFTPRITSVDNAAIVRHAGPMYVIRDAGYDGVIAPGGSVGFQLRGSQRRVRSGPVKFRLDGIPISAATT